MGAEKAEQIPEGGLKEGRQMAGDGLHQLRAQDLISKGA